MSDLRVLVVDDSAMYRRLLSQSVDQLANAKVVGTAPTGSLALQKLVSLVPDVVLLDIEMPEMNGVEVLASIKAKEPDVSVVLISGVNSRSADIVLEGLSKGAVDFIPKPTGLNMEDNVQQLSHQLEQVFKAITIQRYARQARAGAIPAPAAQKPAVAIRKTTSIIPARFDLVVIGISTGGPRALDSVVPRLPATLPVPVVIVQHMPPIFTASLAKTLDTHSKVRVVEAEEGMALENGKVYIAPGGIHTTLEKRDNRLFVKLNDGPPVNSCKPAVDVLFRSVAPLHGGSTLAVVMTGMGQDGKYGVETIKERGGYCLTQSEESCVVYGMPMAVDKAGLSDEQVSLELIAQRISTLITSNR